MMTRVRIAWAILATLYVANAAAEGLRHVRQSIFGMDCAPCAYGVEKSLRALPGVQEVTVSLNEGYAEAELASDTSTTLVQIREVIRSNGFTPKQAILRIDGHFSRGPTPTLHTLGHMYRLHFDEAIPDVADNVHVEITGTVAPDNDDEIAVERIVPIATAQ